jgi:hypothetical protein
MAMYYFRNVTLGEVPVHQRQLVCTPAILLANKGPLFAGDKEAFVTSALFQ